MKGISRPGRPAPGTGTQRNKTSNRPAPPPAPPPWSTPGYPKDRKVQRPGNRQQCAATHHKSACAALQRMGTNSPQRPAETESRRAAPCATPGWNAKRREPTVLRRQRPLKRQPQREGGKNQVSRRQAIPCRVIHKRPGAAAAIVVHHDHEGNGDAAHYIQREQTLGGHGSE